jgi:hypothetical protein
MRGLAQLAVIVAALWTTAASAEPELTQSLGVEVRQLGSEWADRPAPAHPAARRASGVTPPGTDVLAFDSRATRRATGPFYGGIAVALGAAQARDGVAPYSSAGVVAGLSFALGPVSLAAEMLAGGRATWRDADDVDGASAMLEPRAAVAVRWLRELSIGIRVGSDLLLADDRFVAVHVDIHGGQ